MLHLSLRFLGYTLCYVLIKYAKKYILILHYFSYLDPEAVMGCEDGRARIYDMYSGRCSRIIKYAQHLCIFNIQI